MHSVKVGNILFFWGMVGGKFMYVFVQYYRAPNYSILLGISYFNYLKLNEPTENRHIHIPNFFSNYYLQMSF